MSAINKEKVFEDLRAYHVNAFPEKMASDELNSLRKEFSEAEDVTISMLMGLVNGKRVFEDKSKEIEKVYVKVNAIKGETEKEKEQKEFFLTKTKKLMDIMSLAKTYDFQLRKVRTRKVVEPVKKDIAKK